MKINYSEKIPNNVNLSSDRRLQRSLERWQPGYLKWWDELGPEKSTGLEVYLRTAVSVEKGRLGAFRLCKNAGISLGHFPHAF